jgi:hypothetical protein
MTPIDYLLLAGVLLAGGYVVARLFVGWLRSSVNAAEIDRDHQFDAPVGPKRELEDVEKTGAPWRFRK